jgi:hypothetical protein
MAGFAACSTVPPPSLPTPPATEWRGKELIDALSQREKQFRSLRAPARVDYAGPDGKHGFDEAVLVARPDRLRLETLSMVGTVMVVTVNDNEIIGYYVREGIMVRGPTSRENLLRTTQMPLELHEITAVLLGVPPVDSNGRWEQRGNTLLFAGADGMSDAVSFEAQQPVPTRWQRANAAGEVEISVLFADYISTPAGSFPGRLIMEAPLQKRKLDIRYQEPEINPALKAEQFSQQKPAHVKELPIEAVGG